MIITERDIIQEVNRMPAPKEAAAIRKASDVKAELVDVFHNPNALRKGLPIHIEGFDDSIRFRPGEVTAWTGENHTGKSEILNQFILFHHKRIKAFVLSPEMPVYRTLQYMACQALATGRPSKEGLDRFIASIDDSMIFLDQSTTLKPQTIINLIRYVVQQYGVEHVVIDSLMKCGINENEEHGQIKDFIDQLCVTAKGLQIHIHLVAHNMKPRGDGQRPTRYNIKGSGAISDLVDNVIIMWRNENKQYALSEGVKDRVKHEDYMAQPDAKFVVDKQRHGNGWRGVIPLWHWSDERVFLPDRGGRPQSIINAPLRAVQYGENQ